MNLEIRKEMKERKKVEAKTEDPVSQVLAHDGSSTEPSLLSRHSLSKVILCFQLVKKIKRTIFYGT